MISNLLCGVSLQVLLVLQVAGVDLDVSVGAWMSIMVFPLSSLVNPFLHTLKAIILARRAKK